MTRRVGLIGKPLKRRHSQVMHDAAFDAAGIDARYVLLELEPEAVEPAVQEARGEGWLGLGVTAPYKRVVAGLVDAVEAGRRADRRREQRRPRGRSGGWSASTPMRRGSGPAPSSRWGARSSGATVVVVGAGGAAHAVVYACLDAGARWVTIANRTDSTAKALADRFRGVGQGSVAIPSSGLVFEAALAGADLAVNATTVGMLDPGMTIPVELLPDSATVFDLVYVPAETPLVAAARARGLRAANGSEMLIAQAAIAFERWTGVGGMADVMRTAVAPLLADPTVRA